MDQASTRLSRPKLILHQIPMKMMTVALFLALTAAGLYFPNWTIWYSFQPFIGFATCFLLCVAALIACLCTFDSLVIEKSEKSLVFQRKGILISETKAFKLSQISEIRLQQFVTYSRIKAVTSYKLQLVLISAKTVDLFKSFDKKKIRENVGTVNRVCPSFRVSWT